MAATPLDVATRMRAYLGTIDREKCHPGDGEAAVFLTVVTRLKSPDAEGANDALDELFTSGFEKHVTANPFVDATTDDWRRRLNKLGL